MMCVCVCVCACACACACVELYRYCLTQMVSELTPENNILDLFLTNSPTLVDSFSVVSGIANHSTVIGDFRLRSTMQKVNPRTVHMYS